MYLRSIIFRIVVVGLAITTVLQIASAAPGTRAGARPSKKAVDRNKDHKIDRREIQAAKTHLKRKAVVNTPWEKRADKNHNGVVGPLEKRLFTHKVHRTIDVNNDGKISLLERSRYWTLKKSKVNTAVEKKYDTDGNGYISGKEAQEMLRDRLHIIRTHGRAKVNTPLEKEYDTNGDGVIDRNEADDLREAIGDRAIVDKHWEKLADKNKDGVISADERKAFWLKRKSRVNTKIEKKYDTNNDGWIDAEEAKAMMKAILRLVSTNGKAKVNTPVEREFDADGNGIISPQEAQAIHEALRDQD